MTKDSSGPQSSNAEQVMEQLTDFQRATAQHAFNQLWKSPDENSKFLVADEVGLGKTHIARALIAKTVEHLQDKNETIDILYICSNAQIAAQNLNRLAQAVPGVTVIDTRLTMLSNATATHSPQKNHAHKFRTDKDRIHKTCTGKDCDYRVCIHRNCPRDRCTHSTCRPKLRLIALTPGTSFTQRSKGGTVDERALLYWMLVHEWGPKYMRRNFWARFFEGDVDKERFLQHLKDFDRDSICPVITAEFRDLIEKDQRPDENTLEYELEAWAERFERLRRKPDPASELAKKRNAIIARLRMQLALASVRSLNPKLVILDEFHRFKDFLHPDNADTDQALLAREVLDREGTKTLLLSATPYKMYTVADESSSDDHYRDFKATVKYLFGGDATGAETAEGIFENLKVVRSYLATAKRGTLVQRGESNPSKAEQKLLEAKALHKAKTAKAAARQELLKVMCRTERLASTADRDGMLREVPLSGTELTPADVRSWMSLDRIATRLGTRDSLEYWRSTPYPLNFMDQSNYQVSKEFRAAVDEQDSDIRELVKSSAGSFLKWSDFSDYRPIDPGNVKLRGLMKDVIDRGVWRLAWLPPSLPYYSLGGVYAEEQIQRFTKRLVFSSWDVAPKAISVMLSYEAERRAVELSTRSGHELGKYEDRRPRNVGRRPLDYRLKGRRPAAMSLLTLMYPSVTLARIGDPLQIARELNTVPVQRKELFDIVRARIKQEIKALGVTSVESGSADPSWYWAAPLLFDRARAVHDQDEFEQRFGWGLKDPKSAIALELHLKELVRCDLESLGKMPADLAEVLTQAAIGAPGVVALRALSRVCGGEESLTDFSVRDAAFEIASSFRQMFNKPELVTLLRGERPSEFYWHAVLEHCVDGGLQSVLDEYFHMLVGGGDLQSNSSDSRAQSIAEACKTVLGLHTVNNTVEAYSIPARGKTRRKEKHVRLNIAARLGSDRGEDGKVQRAADVREAFNSPFRPFVLSSTSVGQEGLDFHTYSHAVVHWNLPKNPVDLEQREGRVHRYKGHAIRKNIARNHGLEALSSNTSDPWDAMFADAASTREAQANELLPYWVYPDEDGACIERYVPLTSPLSKEASDYQYLLRAVASYRSVIGHPRQERLLKRVNDGLIGQDLLGLDLTPPPSK